MTYERRYSERYKLPGAKINYKTDNGNGHEKSVKDITHSGICFEFSHTGEEGNKLEIELIIPGRDKIVLKGNIVWTSVESQSGPGFAAAQFLPFGTDERYNTMENHKKLRDLMQACIEDNPPNIKFRI